MSNWLLRVENKELYTKYLEDSITIQQIIEKYDKHLNINNN
jgi:hypothetical protein